MSRSKPTKDSEIFALKKIIKDRDDEIRRLHRKLNNELKAEKKAKKAEYKNPKPPPEPKEGSCPECIKGKLIHSDLGVRSLTTCSICSYRKVIKK